MSGMQWAGQVILLTPARLWLEDRSPWWLTIPDIWALSWFFWVAAAPRGLVAIQGPWPLGSSGREEELQGRRSGWAGAVTQRAAGVRSPWQGLPAATGLGVAGLDWRLPPPWLPCWQLLLTGSPGDKG